MAQITIMNDIGKDEEQSYAHHDYMMDILDKIDIKKLKRSRELKEKLKGKKIKHIIVHLYRSDGFKNIANKQISYLYGVSCNSYDDGAVQYQDTSFYLTNHPIGSVIIITQSMKKKSIKKKLPIKINHAKKYKLIIE